MKDIDSLKMVFFINKLTIFNAAPLIFPKIVWRDSAIFCYMVGILTVEKPCPKTQLDYSN